MFDNATLKRQLVSALWTMQHEKCCYSETYISEQGHGRAVEHFRPKSIFQGKRNDWENLLLACAHSNGKKHDKFPTVLTGGGDSDGIDQVVVLADPRDGEPLLIDPSDPDTNPEDYLDFVVDDEDVPLLGQVVARTGCPRGLATIQITGIDAGHFLRMRLCLILDVLFPNYHSMIKHLKNNELVALEEAIHRYVSHMRPTAEFAGVARAFARSKNMVNRFGEYGFCIPE